MSSSAAVFSPDHLSPSDQICVILCDFCDTAQGVNVTCSSLFKSVIVQCYHCFNLSLVNMPGLLLPATNLLEEIRGAGPNNLMMNQPIPKPPVVNKPPEKRRRVPSTFHQFMRDEIKRIKAGNPAISHKEAFGEASKNYAHFSCNHFRLMRQQEGNDVLGHSLLNKGKEKELE